jgi:hypothetical protein
MARLASQTRNDQGVALFAAIAGMVLLSTMIAALVILARNENLIAQLNKDEAQAAYAAEAGANWGRKLLLQRLSVDLPATVSATPRASLKTSLQTTYNSYNGGAQFIRDFAVPASGPAFLSCAGGCPEPNYSAVGNVPDAQQNVLTITCPGTAGCPANLTFTTRVIVGTHPTTPPVVTGGGLAAVFTYVWRVESTGTAGRARQQWVIHDSSVPTQQDGSFKIALNAEFVKYAHFIDQFQDAGSGDPWISWRHEYTGPVHTNTRFSILGDTSVVGHEGPKFRSEATQTMTTTRFNNNGSNQNLSRDSSAADWPLLGPDPGILCKVVDCSGFTRSFDYDPTTPAIDPIPFPGGNNPDDRKTQICMALGVQGAAYGRTNCPATGLAPPTPAVACATIPVIVDNDCVNASPASPALKGGIYVNGTITTPVRQVRDILLAHTNNGQVIVIYTAANRRTVIVEDRTLSQVTVRRECRKATGAGDAGNCLAAGTGGVEWYLLKPTDADGGAIRTQTFSGVFTPVLPSAAGTPPDSGMIYVYNADIGIVDTFNGLRRGTFVALSPAASNNVNGGVDLTPLYAIYQSTVTAGQGSRLTVAADGNIWITGNLNYRIDPRGTDGFFSDPIPGDASGTSADDQMDAQNVLGIVSWATPTSGTFPPATMPGGVRISSALTGDLATHGMVFVANLSGQAEPSGQFSFDDPNGPFRGDSLVLGGVVQKTMGTFGQPSSNLGYARDWVYDERFRYRALSPPAFPGFPNFTAATSLGIDSYSWRLGVFQ